MRKQSSVVYRVALTVLVLACAAYVPMMPAVAGDWPQWRYDAGRTAASPEELPAELHLQWVRRLPPPRHQEERSCEMTKFPSVSMPLRIANACVAALAICTSVQAAPRDNAVRLWDTGKAYTQKNPMGDAFQDKAKWKFRTPDTPPWRL